MSATVQSRRRVYVYDSNPFMLPPFDTFELAAYYSCYLNKQGPGHFSFPGAESIL